MKSSSLISLLAWMVLSTAGVAHADDPQVWGHWEQPGYQPVEPYTLADQAALTDQLAVLGDGLVLPGPAEAAQLDPIAEISALPDSLRDDLIDGVSGAADAVCGLLSLSCP